MSPNQRRDELWPRFPEARGKKVPRRSTASARPNSSMMPIHTATTPNHAQAAGCSLRNTGWQLSRATRATLTFDEDSRVDRVPRSDGPRRPRCGRLQCDCAGDSGHRPRYGSRAGPNRCAGRELPGRDHGRVLTGPPGVKKGRSTAVLLVSLGLVALGSLGFVAGHTLEIYFAARLVMGLGSGGVWIGVTFGTLERWPGQEYLCMSRIFSAYAVGAMVGPALGAIGGIRAPFLAYLALLCASAILVVLMEDPPRTGPSGLISGRFGCPASGSPRPRFSSSCSRSGPWTASTIPGCTRTAVATVSPKVHVGEHILGRPAGDPRLL